MRKTLILLLGLWGCVTAQQVVSENSMRQDAEGSFIDEDTEDYQTPATNDTRTIRLNLSNFDLRRQQMNINGTEDDEEALPDEYVYESNATNTAAAEHAEQFLERVFVCPDPTLYHYVPGVPKSFIFNELSTEEMLEVANFMLYMANQNVQPGEPKVLWWEGSYTNNGKEVPLEEVPTPYTNQILRIQFFPPPKRDAIAFLNGDTAKPPNRYAKVIVIRGSNQDIMEYKVGPLPINPSQATVTALTKDGEIPFVKRPLSPAGTTWILPVVSQAAYDLRDIFKNITGYCYPLAYFGTDPEDYDKAQQECPGEGKLDYLPYPLFTNNGNERISRIHWYFFPGEKMGDEGNLHSLPITFTVNETDPDFYKWTAYDFEYCNQGPFTKDELLQEWTNGNLTVCSPDDWLNPNYNFNWSSTYTEDRWKERQPMPPSDSKTGPRQYEPEGKRYILVGNDTNIGRRFAWMGWEGHITMRPDTGIALYDITFKDERIIYELSLQDQYVAYSGFSGAGQVLYFDSNFGMGITTNGLRHGIDCPESAIFFDQSKMFLNGQVLVDRDVICMFEMDMAETEWRHMHAASAPGPRWEGIRRTELVVRSISTISNYDYIYDIRFKLDGSIGVKIQMAGYMESLYYDPVNSMTNRDVPFGTRVGKYTFANLHDHLSGWKVDLDIKGPTNSFQTSTVRYGTYEEALRANNIHPPPKQISQMFDPNAEKEEDENFYRPQWFPYQKLKYLDTKLHDKELGLNVNISAPTVWQFINQYSKENYYPAGYAIAPGATHLQLLDESHPYTKAAAWTKYHLAVTQHKDEEYVSHAAMYDLYIPDKPYRSLDQFLNDESIENQDLVAWVMVGLEHVPRSEDVPLISNLGVHFEIKPWNYFSELQSMDIVERTTFAPNCVPNSGSYFNYYWVLDN